MMSRRNKAKRFESIALAIIIAVSFSFGLSSVALHVTMNQKMCKK